MPQTKSPAGDTGRLNYHAGLAAEDCVARAYEARGAAVAHKRWRGAGGEIDLVLREGETLVFVEVKKSRTFEAAARRISATQIARIFAAASGFIAGEPAGQLTPVRFDAALVDATGAVSILPGALHNA
ncbi:YraN family protein [Roseobacter ponti]|uniref:UPF0102 protein G3256_02080 n=1 Tax=Roseobacter ponti TaxID=1891787 RepID=A0A858SQA8_9RHOB|nr:YraN family protein [Roseobacter ponti]QJF50038.1 hypothetical protein G3256_02080 [Roseobacter ponti]